MLYKVIYMLLLLYVEGTTYTVLFLIDIEFRIKKTKKTESLCADCQSYLVQ